MSKTLKQVQGLLTRPLIYCDIGARAGLQEPWIDFQSLIHILSFEPDQEEYRVLKGKSHDAQKMILKLPKSDPHLGRRKKFGIFY